MEEFKGCGPTIKFLRTIYRLFDFLNLRNPCGKGFKKPIYRDNIESLKQMIMPLVQYLFTLYDATGVPAHKCPCKTYTLGFGLAVKAVFHIVSEFFSKTKFKYFLTYFHSQDPLEITFSKVRRRGGHNNNPNVQQFKGAMKRLLLKNSIVASAAANCTTLADGKSYGGILEIKWRPKKKDSIVLRKGVDLEGEEEEQVLDLEQLVTRGRLKRSRDF